MWDIYEDCFTFPSSKHMSYIIWYISRGGSTEK